MLGNHKGKRNFALAQQMNEAILDLIKSINTGVEKEIVSVKCPVQCPDCGEMVYSFKNHPCKGGAA